MFSKFIEIREHTGPVYHLTFDGKFLYSTAADKFITRWNSNDGTQDAFAIKLDFPAYTIQVIDNLLIAGCNNGDVHVFDVIARQEIKFLKHHQSAIFSIALSSKRNEVYVGDAEGNLSIWNSKNWSLKAMLPLVVGKIRNIEVNQDELYLACQDGNLRVIDLNTLNETNHFYAHKDGVCSTLIWDNNYQFSSGKDAYIRVWDRLLNKVVLAKPVHNYAVYRMLRIGENLISCSRDKSIKVWDDQLNPIQKLDAKSGGHSHSVNDMIYLNDKLFASCGDDRRIIIWKKDN